MISNRLHRSGGGSPALAAMRYVAASCGRAARAPMKLVLLSFLLIASSVTVAAQEKSLTPQYSTPQHCEVNDMQLDNAHHLAGDDTVIIAVARLGTGERNPALNRRRLHNIKAYLTSFAWQRRLDTVVTAEGERVDGFGRIDIYVRGELWATMAVRRNQDLILGLCEPDYMRGREETRTFYPWRDRKKH